MMIFVMVLMRMIMMSADVGASRGKERMWVKKAT